MECDPSIKSIIVKIDSEKNDFIVEELDDQTLVIKEGMLQILKMRLNEVTPFFPSPTLNLAFTPLPKRSLYFRTTYRAVSLFHRAGNSSRCS